MSHDSFLFLFLIPSFVPSFLMQAADVERVIRAVRPDNVVVELCRSRAGMRGA